GVTGICAYTRQGDGHHGTGRERCRGDDLAQVGCVEVGVSPRRDDPGHVGHGAAVDLPAHLHGERARISLVGGEHQLHGEGLVDERPAAAEHHRLVLARGELYGGAGWGEHLLRFGVVDGEHGLDDDPVLDGRQDALLQVVQVARRERRLVVYPGGPLVGHQAPSSTVISTETVRLLRSVFSISTWSKAKMVPVSGSSVPCEITAMPRMVPTPCVSSR